MGHIIDFDSDTRKSDNCAINHGRYIWTNNEKIIKAHKLKIIADMHKNIEKDNRVWKRLLG